MKPIYAIIAGSLAGALYFSIGERAIPKESNCAYLAPVATDIFAWLGASILMARAVQKNDPVAAFLGSTVMSIHIAQFAAHKTLDQRQ